MYFIQRASRYTYDRSRNGLAHTPNAVKGRGKTRSQPSRVNVPKLTQLMSRVRWENLIIQSSKRNNCGTASFPVVSSFCCHLQC
ncbi:hypothetical protein TNIN_192691 [Trichonephila inaurata madagascariensis]|uniref:Uncharacterized protein n=1 Tax=Trichonephila inaurata madagascariensis TaxID=2747483 RepID=A0A8X7CAE1_9ARAC|nr:hypothetical protein TNIN_192691 [Trichonephila inaurata madagascariensis]